jgi:hypothetical protein
MRMINHEARRGRRSSWGTGDRGEVVVTAVIRHDTPAPTVVS